MMSPAGNSLSRYFASRPGAGEFSALLKPSFSLTLPGATPPPLWQPHGNITEKCFSHSSWLRNIQDFNSSEFSAFLIMAIEPSPKISSLQVSVFESLSGNPDITAGMHQQVLHIPSICSK
jgi:hypothetical protein